MPPAGDVMIPIGECISTKALVELAQYQWLNYQTKLDILSGDQDYTEQFFIESLAEIDRLMRQKPHYPKGVKWHG